MSSFMGNSMTTTTGGGVQVDDNSRKFSSKKTRNYTSYNAAIPFTTLSINSGTYTGYV